MKLVPFWRGDSFTAEEQELLERCLHAHALSAMRDNVSSVTLQYAARGSGDYVQSLVAALSTLGGTHAPLLETYDLLCNSGDLSALMATKKKVPGWGNSFVKGERDELWGPVAHYLEAHFPMVDFTIAFITTKLHCAEKDIYPNPSCYTAATAIALKMPREIAPFLFVAGRLPSWTALFCDSLNL